MSTMRYPKPSSQAAESIPLLRKAGNQPQIFQCGPPLVSDESSVPRTTPGLPNRLLPWNHTPEYAEKVSRGLEAIAGSMAEIAEDADLDKLLEEIEPLLTSIMLSVGSNGKLPGNAGHVEDSKPIRALDGLRSWCKGRIADGFGMDVIYVLRHLIPAMAFTASLGKAVDEAAEWEGLKVLPAIQDDGSPGVCRGKVTGADRGNGVREAQVVIPRGMCFVVMLNCFFGVIPEQLNVTMQSFTFAQILKVSRPSHHFKTTAFFRYADRILSGLGVISANNIFLGDSLVGSQVVSSLVSLPGHIVVQKRSIGAPRIPGNMFLGFLESPDSSQILKALGSDADVPLSAARVIVPPSASQSISACVGAAFVNFSAATLGGGTLRTGCVQEEILMNVCPEAMVGLGVASRMVETESLVICGAHQLTVSSGYGTSNTKDAFSMFGPLLDQHVEMIAMDAINVSGKKMTVHEEARSGVVPKEEGGKKSKGKKRGGKGGKPAGVGLQITPRNLVRDFFKARCGFTPVAAYYDEAANVPVIRDSQRPISTGNWGCGAFGCDVFAAFLKQFAACAASNRDMVYCAFGDESLVEAMLEFQAVVSSSPGTVTVGDLLTTLAIVGHEITTGAIRVGARRSVTSSKKASGATMKAAEPEVKAASGTGPPSFKNLIDAVLQRLYPTTTADMVEDLAASMSKVTV